QDDRVPALRRDGYAVEQERRIALQVDQAVEGEDDVRGGQRRAVGELDVLLQEERVGLRVSGGLVRVCEQRHRVGDVAALVRQQRVVDAAVEDVRGRLECPL